MADLCDETTVQGGYGLPTIWSNSAAAKGGDPCVPAIGLPYISVDPSPRHVTIPARAGASVDVTLTGWSTALVGDWLIRAFGPGRLRRGLHREAGPDRDRSAQQRREREADRDDGRLGARGQHGDRPGDVVRRVRRRGEHPGRAADPGDGRRSLRRAARPSSHTRPSAGRSTNRLVRDQPVGPAHPRAAPFGPMCPTSHVLPAWHHP